ncbi:MAG: sugar ABC transporter substrate-binding protein [Solirubrobacterales bacterium]
MTLVVAGLLVAGCGDDDEDEEVSAGGDATAIVGEAQEMIEEASQPLTFEPPGPEIDASKADGNTLALVIVDERVPTLASAADAAEEAAEAAGISTTRFDAQAQVNRMQQGMAQAIGDADAMALLGIPIAAVEASLRDAEQAGVPAISVLNNQPEANEPGQGAGPLVYASSAPDYRAGGALAAAKAIVDTNGEANTEIFNTEEITPSVDVVEGMRSVLDRCDGCQISENSTPLAEWSTALQGKAQDVIRENPDLNYILPIFDNMAIFITAGIQQAGAGDRVRNASVNGTPAALELIEEDGVFTADVGQPNGWLGWHVVDQALRGMLDEDPSDPAIPIRFLDASNLEGVDVNDIDAPFGDDLGYEEGFMQLWGVG